MTQSDSYKGLKPLRDLKDQSANYLKFIGLWRPDVGGSIVARRLYNCYNKIALTVMFVFAGTLFADIASNLDDLPIATDDGCVFAGIFVVLFKATVQQIRHEEIGRLTEETIEHAESLCRSAAPGARAIVRKYTVRCRVCFYGFSALGFLLTVALILLVPTEEGALPIRARYPFDTTRSPWHQIAYLTECLAVVFGMTAIVSMDSTLTILCNLVLLQFEILAHDLTNCKARRDDRNSHGLHETSEFLRRFKRSLRDHQRSVSIIDKLNEVYSSSMFVQVLSSTSIICLTGFQAVVVVGQSENFAKFALYLCAAVSQLLYVCWVGNELMHYSTEVRTAQWLSDWHHCPMSSVGSLLIFSGMFTKKSLTLKAGKFYTVSLQGFITILRGSYSFFALLNNVHLTDGV